jgi:membrane protein required for colicin V production
MPMNSLPSINPFDAAVYLCLAVAIYAGFRSGLLRALATIFGYACAAPVAVAAEPLLTPILAERLHLPQEETWAVLFAVFIVIGIVLGTLCRMAVGEVTGPHVGLADRMAGALLGALRVVLLAVLMVLIFDRIIPPGHAPGFLTGSHLKPILSMAGQQGLRSLPPDVTDYIDRLKRERGI